MNRTALRLALAGLAAVVTSALPVLSGPAHATAPDTAGSLVYVKDYNVWIARVDGSGARPLTTDGSFGNQYHSPTQSDTGLVAVAHAGLIYELSTGGRVVRTLDPPALKDDLNQPIDGTPANVAISPDGTLIAYSFGLYDCPIASPGCETRYATGYTAADHITDPAPYGTTEYDSPSWVGNHRTVQGGGYLAEINLQEVGQAPTHWFRMNEINSSRYDDLSDPAVSRDGSLVATIMGYGSNRQVLWSTVTGDVRTGTPGIPQPLCLTNAGNLASPAFSADGSELAWSLDNDIWIASDPAHCGQPVKTVLGGTEPSFSAAPYTAAPVDAAFTCVAAPKVAGKARIGKKLHAGTGSWSASPSSYDYQWLRNGKAIKGAHAASYTVGRKDAGKKLAVQVTAHTAGAAQVATSAPVKVARHPR